MIDELVSKVSQKTGLSPDQAKAAVESVIAFLKEKLPAPVATHLDSLVSGVEGSGEGSSEGLASKATAAVGNLFGNS